MKANRRLIGAAILLTIVVAFAVLSFGGVLNLPGSANDVAVLWRNSITPAVQEVGVLWRNSITPAVEEVGVLWRNSIIPAVEDVAVG
jgi:hypothetical protein